MKVQVRAIKDVKSSLYVELSEFFCFIMNGDKKGELMGCQWDNNLRERVIDTAVARAPGSGSEGSAISG